MCDINHETMELAFWKIFDCLLSHPWQVSAAYLSLVSRVEEAIITLNKLFMSLEKVHNLIPQLWHIEISRLQLEQVLFVNSFSNGIKLIESEIVETFICIIFEDIIVLLVSTKQAHEHCLSLIGGQKILALAVVPVKSSVALLALNCCTRQKASVACELPLFNQIFNCRVNVEPFLAIFVILNKIVCF